METPVHFNPSLTHMHAPPLCIGWTLSHTLPLVSDVFHVHTHTHTQEAATGHSKSDRALSHLLVLLQYEWPKEEEMFAHVITMIQKRRKFSFPEFFKYVISIPSTIACPVVPMQSLYSVTYCAELFDLAQE